MKKQDLYALCTLIPPMDDYSGHNMYLCGKIALFEYVNGSYIPYIQCKDKDHTLSYINVLERLSVPFDVI